MEGPSIVPGSSLATTTIPHYINEDKSDMRGIKSGWYAMDDDGNLSSGPFPSLEECVTRITAQTTGLTRG
jgi:hypothetical protein